MAPVNQPVPNIRCSRGRGLKMGPKETKEKWGEGTPWEQRRDRVRSRTLMNPPTRGHFWEPPICQAWLEQSGTRRCMESGTLGLQVWRADLHAQGFCQLQPTDWTPAYPPGLGLCLIKLKKSPFPSCVSVTIQHHQDTGL